MKKQPTYIWGILLLFLILFAPLPIYADTESYKAQFTPWSGYWWPFYRGGLATGSDYRKHPAPIEKYEMLTTGTYPGELTSWYKEKYYDIDAPGWFGLCLYWAWASVYENYEIMPSSNENIVFRVGDKKGLLTLNHNNDMIEQDYAYTPDIFHHWLTYYIKDQKKAFVADLDGGEEIWSYPVFQYEIQSESSSGLEHVEVTIYYANDFVHPDYMGTDIRQITYTYDLYRSGEEIIGGEWTGASISNHPDKLSIPTLAQTDCPYLNYEKVLEIAKSKDDFLESGADLVNVFPGTYNLILMDEDHYRFNCSADDIIQLIVEKQDGSQQDINFSITDGNNNVIKTGLVTVSEPVDLILSETVPPYTISLSQEDYSDPNIYTLKLDIQRNTNQIIPYIPKNGMWSGFALTNPNDAPVNNVMLTTYTEEGRPIQTVLGPMTLASGERKVFLFKDLPYRRHELADTAMLKLMAEGDIRMVNLFGNSDNRMADFSQISKKQNRIIIPDTSAPLDFTRSMSGGIINSSFDDLLLEMRLYSESGNLVSEMVNEPLTSRSLLPLRPSEYPFYNMPSSGWIEIKDPEENPLTGFQYVRSGAEAESIFALYADKSHKIVPQIPEPGFWQTRVTLINPNNAENTVQFHLRKAGDDYSQDMEIMLNPNEKRVVDLHELFGKSEGAPLHHSILDINGKLPVAGYYTFSSPYDNADLPLLDEDDFKNELILPHYAGDDGFWWTGAGVFNPSESSAEIIALPYDQNGQMMFSAMTQIVLAPGEYKVFLIKDMFEASYMVSDISFVRFSSPNNEIGGFYLYGDLECKMLAGGNM